MPAGAIMEMQVEVTSPNGTKTTVTVRKRATTASDRTSDGPRFAR
jgi:hypothetical protein